MEDVEEIVRRNVMVETQVGDQFVREVKIQMRKIEMRKVNERYQREVEQIFVGMRSSLA